MKPPAALKRTVRAAPRAIQLPRRNPVLRDRLRAAAGIDVCSISCKGVEGNGPGGNYGTEDPGLSSVLRSGRRALSARAEPAQQGEGVEAGGVAALKSDLQRVLADEAHVLDPELVRCEALQVGKAAGRSRLASTFGAWACPSKLLSRIGAAVATLPLDLHHLALAVCVDLEWKRVWVLQLLCPSLTGR